MVRSTLADSELPKSFWAEALTTAVYLRNQSPTKYVEGKTSYEAIYGEKPKAGHLGVLPAYSHIDKDKRQKLDAKARKCILLGYPSIYVYIYIYILYIYILYLYIYLYIYIYYN